MEVDMQLTRSPIEKLRNLLRLTLVCLAAWLFCPLAAFTQGAPPTNFSDAAEASRFQSIATQVLHLKLGANPKLHSEANMIGFRTDTVLVSRRLDSRTYLVQDLRTNRERPFQGTDQELLGYTRRILTGLNVPTAEIAQVRVLREQEQLAHVNPDSQKVEFGKVTPGNRWANVSRRIDGISVFSSRAMIQLDSQNQLRFMELHWPAIPPETLTEAKRLAYKVKAGWKPPEMEGATVESSEAGILHSPALGFVMDIYPVIRVIYKPVKEEIGKKPVRYLDRNGQDVPMPRQFAETIPPPREKRERGPETQQK
jgi:hypothetical protein